MKRRTGCIRFIPRVVDGSYIARTVVVVTSERRPKLNCASIASAILCGISSVQHSER